MHYKKGLLALLFWSISNIILAQNSIPNYWDAALNNDRETALKEVKKAYSSNPTIETLMAREIIRWENGLLSPSKKLIDEFIEFGDDRDYYLFALWNEPFIFGDYLSEDMNNITMDHVDRLYSTNFKHPTIKCDLAYLKGIKSRVLNDFTGYEKYVREVKAIRDWQYCGVFENMNGSGIDAIYPPETDPIGGSGFNANSNGIVDWYVPVNDPEGYMKLTNHEEYGMGVHYAQTFINAPADQECVIRVGNSSKFKLWLNDVLIYENTKQQGTTTDAYSVKVNIPAGNNRLLIKTSVETSFGYFSLRITDDSYHDIDGLTYSNKYADYNKSTEETINPRMITSAFEDFFINKSESGDDFLYDYCLIKTYLRNERYEEAKEVIEPWFDKYEKSSMLRIMMTTISDLEDDSNKVDELRENIKNDDPDYHLTLMMYFLDVQELFRLSFEDMSEVVDDYAESVDSELVKISAEIIKALRLEDKKLIKKYLDELMDLALEMGNVKLMKTYASLYGRVLNDDAKTQLLYEKINNKYYDIDIVDKLARIYNSQNKKAKTKKLLEEKVEKFDTEIAFYKDYVSYLHYLTEYEESVPYIERALELFPYSFRAMEYMGDALLQLNDKEGAIEWYQKSLVHNSANSTLRRKIRDILNEPDIVEEYKIQDVYDYIEENKNKTKSNNYGYNFLLDEVIVELNKEAGGRTRVTYLFEITSEKGVERLKEYSLGLYRNYDIIKSEIVKANGSIVPAESSGSRFVFNGLEVGDVIYIDYQVDFNGYGRFYRDHMDDYQFTSYHPLKLARYTLISPQDIKIKHEVVNGELEFESTTKGDRDVYIWTLKDHPGLPESERFMPEESDVNITLHMSSLEGWNDIANWYSDLVRQQIEINSVVKKAFAEIFPDGTQAYSEKERAELIYEYMADNLTYSFVSFKQSGYIPQKPSKTLKTKMGDCKDLSTLFVVLADLAGLEANLVLISTRRNGIKKLVMPSISFDHCIVKVILDGKEVYLELTDNNMPFMSLPTRDRGAQILEIPRNYDDDKTYELSNLDDRERLINSYNNNIKMYIEDDKKRLIIDAKIQGSIRSSTADILDNDSYTIMKKDLVNRYHSSINSSCTLDSVYNIKNDKHEDFVSYTAEVSYTEKTNKIGKYYVVQLPYVVNVYTGSVIAEDERDYPIEYMSYESTDVYNTEFDLFVEEGKSFTELPESKNFAFRDHKYSRTYELIAPNHLRVTIHATPGSDNISPEQYEEFKAYVNKVLEAKDEFVAFE